MVIFSILVLSIIGISFLVLGVYLVRAQLKVIGWIE